jgi:hypothetical protein
MRERDRICNEALVSRYGCVEKECVEKELDFRLITDVTSQRLLHFGLIAKPRIFLLEFCNFSIR